MKKATRDALLSNLRDKPIHNRATVDFDSINEEDMSIDFIMVSKNNSGLRYDWWSDEIYEEELDPRGATFDGLNTFFKDHIMSVDTAMGEVTNARLEDGQNKSRVFFNRDDVESVTLFNKYKNRVLKDVSIGYSIEDVTITERKDENTHVLVTKYNIHELSAVWKGFDSGAQVGREVENNLKKEETPNEKDLARELKNKNRARKLKLLELQNKTNKEK